MGHARQSNLPDQLLGKKVVFHGKFGYGERERLAALTQVQQGQVCDELDASIHLLVLPDLAAGKTIQKKVLSLNSKGAAIQLLDADGFEAMARLSEAQAMALIRGGKQKAEIFHQAQKAWHIPVYLPGKAPSSALTFVAENFDGLDLSGFNFRAVAFEQCSFAGTTLTNTSFGPARNCNFSRARSGPANAAEAGTPVPAGFAAHEDGPPNFADVDGSRFTEADLKGAHFGGGISNADFSGAVLEASTFTSYIYGTSRRAPGTTGCTFAGAMLRGSTFYTISLKSADFSSADLTGCAFSSCTLESVNFTKTVLEDAALVACSLVDANLSGANCRRANFAEADLTRASFDHADLTDCNLRGATLKGAELSNAINYDPNAIPAGSIGPALAELDSVAQKARRIRISFRIHADGSEDDDLDVGIDTMGLKHWWGLSLPRKIGQLSHRQPGATFSQAMIRLANVLATRKVRYETIDIQSTKSPTGGKELRDLVMKGICEAFAQPMPPAEELLAAVKAYREQTRGQQSADREQREKARALARQQKSEQTEQIARKIAQEVGKVTDIASFLKALEVRIEKQKIDKATKMLKASRFQLFNDVTDTYLNGVVKSQTDPDLVYACRLEAGGAYACCTQNLNVCGGLRGSICKHLLVLIIGLVKAGELDPAVVDGWIASSHDVKPELNKETMGEIFIRYKGAEAGEVDWRPTQTVPEDYYAL